LQENIVVTHGQLRTTSDSQQQIREMAVNLIFEN
jgi:thymidylate synthase ThyX